MSQMSRLPCHQRIDMSQDRGRILPLGGRSEGNAGFNQSTGKTVDTPNAYHKFSRRTPRLSAANESYLTPRNGAMSAQGETTHRMGKRPLSSPRGGSNSYMNAIEATPNRGKFMTGAEDRIVARRTYLEDNPRKLTKHVAPPVRVAPEHASGRDPFITANGQMGKYQVSPGGALKNTRTTHPDMDMRSAARARAIEESGRQPARYASQFRTFAKNNTNSPMHPETLPMHPEITTGGMGKTQRFAPTRRNEASLQGVFQPPVQRAPPPYKLVPPFHVQTE